MLRLPLWAAVTAALLIATSTPPARSAELGDLRAAVGAAAEQAKLLFGRAGALVREQRGGQDLGSVSVRDLSVQVDRKPLPLKAFDKFVPDEVKGRGKEAVGAFVSGKAKVAPDDGRAVGRLGIETRGLSFGSDLRLGDDSSAGVAFGYASTPSSGGVMEAETLSVYGAHARGRLGLEWVAGAGRTRTTGSQGAGGTEGGAIAFAGGGAHLDLRPMPGLGVLPWVRLDVSGADADGSPAEALSGSGLARVSASAGVAVGYEIDVPWGRLRPHAALDLRQQAEEGGDRLDKQAQAVGASAKALPATKPEATLRLGLVAQPEGGPAMTLDHVSERDATGAKTHSVRARMKMKF